MSPTSYPPPGHFLGELAIEFPDDGDGDWRRDGATGRDVEASMCADSGLSYDAETVPAGVLATFVDLVAGRICAGAAQPDWVATSDLSIVQARPLCLGRLWARGRVVRAGRNLVTSTVELGEEGSADAVALATAAFGRLGGDSRGARKQPSAEPAREKPQGSDRPAVLERPQGTLLQRLGLESSSQGVQADLRDYTSNSLGALQGGVAAMMFERAALEHDAVAAGSSQWVSELNVRYLSLGRRGPFRTKIEAEVSGERACALRLSIRDLGALRQGQARLLSLATAVVR